MSLGTEKAWVEGLCCCGFVNIAKYSRVIKQEQFCTHIIRSQGMHDSFWKYLTPIVIIWISGTWAEIHTMTTGVRYFQKDSPSCMHALASFSN